MNEIYKEPKLKSLTEWLAILIEHRQGRMSDGKVLSEIMELQDAYKDLHYSVHAVVEQFKKPYNKQNNDQPLQHNKRKGRNAAHV